MHTSWVLWGLLALMIPIIIHLISKSRGRIVPFAHIALIRVKSAPRLRQLNLTQWFLLVLRCSLILLITLLVAKLYWQSTSGKSEHHMLVTEDWLNHASKVQKEQWGTSGQPHSIILLGQTNRELSLQEITQWPNVSSQLDSINVWELAAQYRASVPTDVAVSVYTTNRLSQFSGPKVSSQYDITWHIELLPSNTEIKSAPMKVMVLSDGNDEPLLPYLTAAFEALKTNQNWDVNVAFYALNNIPQGEPFGQSTDYIIYLAEGPWSQWIAQQPFLSPVPVLKREQLGEVSQADFPLQLFDRLLESQLDDQQFANGRLSKQQITGNDGYLYSDMASQAGGLPLNIGLWMLLLCVFCAERLLSEWPLAKSMLSSN